jgi:uncharacterized protein YjbI with pentapeptide repeats
MSKKDHDSADEELPEPHDGMAPEEKGELLLRYVKAGRPVATWDRKTRTWHRLDFSHASISPYSSKGVHFFGARLDGADLRHGHFIGMEWQKARLVGANLQHAVLSHGSLQNANLMNADLSDALLDSINMRGTDLSHACLRRAGLVSADLRAASLVDTDLSEADLRDVRVNLSTFQYSGWTPEELRDLHLRGGRIDDLNRFPKEAQFAVIGATEGLTLTFDTRLHRFDPTAFDALIAQVLGPGTDVTIEERSNIDVVGPSFIRINGNRAEDLVLVAEAFYDRIWRATEAVIEERVLQVAMSSGVALLLGRLDEMRDHLVKVEANTAILGDEDVQEAITDMSREHVQGKRDRMFKTRLQRIADGIVKEAPKKLLATVIGESAAGVLGEVVGEALSTAIGAAAETAVEETAKVMMDEDEGEEG